MLANRSVMLIAGRRMSGLARFLEPAATLKVFRLYAETVRSARGPSGSAEAAKTSLHVSRIRQTGSAERRHQRSSAGGHRLVSNAIDVDLVKIRHDDAASPSSSVR